MTREKCGRSNPLSQWIWIALRYLYFLRLLLAYRLVRHRLLFLFWFYWFYRFFANLNLNWLLSDDGRLHHWRKLGYNNLARATPWAFNRCSFSVIYQFVSAFRLLHLLFLNLFFLLMFLIFRLLLDLLFCKLGSFKHSLEFLLAHLLFT